MGWWDGEGSVDSIVGYRVDGIYLYIPYRVNCRALYPYARYVFVKRGIEEGRKKWNKEVSRVQYMIAQCR